MPQQTFAEVTFEQYRKPIRRERVSRRDEPCCAVVRLGSRDRAGLSQGRGAGVAAGGRRAHAALHFLQQWFNLSDLAVEEAL